MYATTKIKVGVNLKNNRVGFHGGIWREEPEEEMMELFYNL